MAAKFIDDVQVQVRSGHGGSGALSFRREKYVEFGGPDGGMGGRGGDVVIRASSQLSTLLDYRFQSRHFAERGQPGECRNMTGRDGEPIVLQVPVGTFVYALPPPPLTATELAAKEYAAELEAASKPDPEQQEQDAKKSKHKKVKPILLEPTLLRDLDYDGAEFIVAKGGRGGKGNQHFKSSTRQAPKYCQPGEDGEELWLRLELKVLADVGLIGLPNVGKSSLIARISAAKPKIADYPFTTLVPNLGVVQFGDMQHYVVADVPGLIVGAHEGAGLGARFLRHVERVKRIVHLVTVVAEDPDRDPIADFEAIEREMALHDEKLTKVPRVLVLNRCDLPDVTAEAERIQAYAKDKGLACFVISAVTGAGVKALVAHLGQVISQEKAEQ